MEKYVKRDIIETKALNIYRTIYCIRVKLQIDKNKIIRGIKNMATLFGLVPIPFLDNKQTEALVVGTVVAVAMLYLAPVGILGPVVPARR